MRAMDRPKSESISMNYKLDFYTEVLKEWQKLDANIKEQFKKS